jgi:N-acetylmuramoyl-L-alanine amidase
LSGRAGNFQSVYLHRAVLADGSLVGTERLMRHIITAAALSVLVGACTQTTREAPPTAWIDTAPPSRAVTAAPLVPPPVKLAKRSVDPVARDCLAEAVYFESRGEPRDGQIAVAHVVMNRVAHHAYPAHVCEVIREGEELGKGRCQFHWRCDGRPDEPTEEAAWQEAQSVAEEVLAGSVPDPTQGALFFHAAHVRPYWASKFRRTARIGSHVYYAR